MFGKWKIGHAQLSRTQEAKQKKVLMASVQLLVIMGSKQLQVALTIEGTSVFQYGTMRLRMVLEDRSPLLQNARIFGRLRPLVERKVGQLKPYPVDEKLQVRPLEP
ncbi:hypothetical protein T265_02265 [Opisthorchis viverrini]|uniref:Uncharacterized protein n=1 Tax=Opisthorchis viverrini TaxID=6198 RepID=A0A075AIE5_OPIVI|nr:hypothetical protein T265_02265 [Opisthorchis viverrini]KER31494.1 hypothetical protein T265_02265 [Opisthorchis viverrini]